MVARKLLNTDFPNKRHGVWVPAQGRDDERSVSVIDGYRFAPPSCVPAAATRRANHFVRRATPCPALSEKIFWFSETANQVYIRSIPLHTEGRCATSRTRSGMRWTRIVPLTRAPDADGEVAWS